MVKAKMVNEVHDRIQKLEEEKLLSEAALGKLL